MLVPPENNWINLRPLDPHGIELNQPCSPTLDFESESHFLNKNGYIYKKIT